MERPPSLVSFVTSGRTEASIGNSGSGRSIILITQCVTFSVQPQMAHQLTLPLVGLKTEPPSTRLSPNLTLPSRTLWISTQTISTLSPAPSTPISSTTPPFSHPPIPNPPRCQHPLSLPRDLTLSSTKPPSTPSSATTTLPQRSMTPIIKSTSPVAIVFNALIDQLV